ncbi:MAG: hypothetical protein HC862_21195 [Scytonema sp. RU_4_4]|nr:hypothetical protein [Scytonema sp. RU_4_4]NJR72795.1 hypothetical protein [Scytonema sp. CRU_2_7]
MLIQSVTSHQLSVNRFMVGGLERATIINQQLVENKKDQKDETAEWSLLKMRVQWQR